MPLTVEQFAQRVTLGNYVLLDNLGQGGMGMVLKARHRRMGRVVALKVMSPASVKSPDAVKRFHREAQTAAKLTHPNIVTAFDADEAKGHTSSSGSTSKGTTCRNWSGSTGCCRSSRRSSASFKRRAD